MTKVQLSKEKSAVPPIAVQNSLIQRRATTEQSPNLPLIQSKSPNVLQKLTLGSTTSSNSPLQMFQRGIGTSIQRNENMEEEPAQTKAIQRNENMEEEPAQTKAIQRNQEMEEEPAQTKAIANKKPTQTKEIEPPIKPARNAMNDYPTTQLKEDNALIQKSDQMEQEEPAQTKAIQKKDNEVIPSSGGQKLPERIVQKAADVLGADVSGVRLHTDSAKNEQFNSLAYSGGGKQTSSGTVQGKSIQTAEGGGGLPQYTGDIVAKPGVSDQVLGHELTHIVTQQATGQVPNQVEGNVYNNPAMEAHADQVGSKF